MGEKRENYNLFLSTVCTCCKKRRVGEKVFRECDCILKRLYSNAEIAKIKEDCAKYRACLLGFDRRSSILAFTVEYIRVVSGMQESTKALLNKEYGQSCLASIDDEVSRLRSIPLDTAIKIDITNADRRMFYYMTPEIARIINYQRCIYLDDNKPCNHQPDTVLCYKHMAILYAAHIELSSIMPKECVKCCLYYLLQDYDTVKGCVPVKSSDSSEEV